MIKQFLLCAFIVLAGVVPALAQSTNPVGYLSTASNNATLVFGGPALVNAILPINTTTTLYYLKLYDKVTAPVCATDVPKWRIPIPFGASNSGGGIALPAGGLQFNFGFGFCLVGALADGDNSNAAAGVALNFGISGR